MTSKKHTKITRRNTTPIDTLCDAYDTQNQTLSHVKQALEGCCEVLRKISSRLKAIEETQNKHTVALNVILSQQLKVTQEQLKEAKQQYNSQKLTHHSPIERNKTTI